MSKFLDLFEKEKPVIGMLHLGRSDTKELRLDLTKFEIDAYMENGIDGVIVEDYFGDLEDVSAALEYLRKLKNDIIYGVNYLRDYKTAFELAEEFEAKFIQLDSVSGHLWPTEDIIYGNELKVFKEETGIPIIGGVRFKYQPYRSGRSLEEDLQLGIERSNGIVVTGEGTGLETPINKAKEFRKIIKDFPLIIGAGLTIDNCVESMMVGDAAIVGSYVKNNYKDSGIVSSDHVKRLVNKIDTIRK